jgi:hypothetical protein
MALTHLTDLDCHRASARASEPQPHIIITIFSQFKKHQKNIGKYSKITAKYSNFRGLGAKNHYFYKIF